MKKINIFPILFIFLITSPLGVITYIFIHAFLTEQIPPVMVHPSLWQIGNVYKGDKIDHYFYLSNPTFNPIDIVRVAPSCGCTVFNLSNHRIPPHGTLKGAMIINTSSKEGRFAINTKIFVANYKKPLYLHAFGKAIKSSPKEVDLGNILNGQVKDTSFEITSLTQPNLKISKLYYDKRYFNVKSIPHGDIVKVEIRTFKNIDVGEFVVPITFFTNDQKYPKVVTQITGYVYPPLIFSNYPVSLGVFHDPALIRKTLKITSPYRTPFIITRVVSYPTEVLKIKWNEHCCQAFNQYLKIYVNKNIKTGPVAAKIFIYTNLSKKRLLIPAYGLYF